jgi:hypothetical protein
VNESPANADRTREALLLELEEHERALLDAIPGPCSACGTFRLSPTDIEKSAPHAKRIAELRALLNIQRRDPEMTLTGLDGFTQPVAAWKLIRGEETTSGAFCHVHLAARRATGWMAESEEGWFAQPGAKTPCPDCQVS